MTKQDEAREAFEKAVADKYAYIQIATGHPFNEWTGHEQYLDKSVQGAWIGWQAALATLPKVTEAELAETMKRWRTKCKGGSPEQWECELSRKILARFPFLGREKTHGIK